MDKAMTSWKLQRFLSAFWKSSAFKKMKESKNNGKNNVKRRLFAENDWKEERRLKPHKNKNKSTVSLLWKDLDVDDLSEFEVLSDSNGEDDDHNNLIETVSDRELTLVKENLPWLLNFQVEKLFQDISIYHDHSYELKQSEENFLDESNLKSDECLNSKTDFQKPPYTYTELIELALNERSELTVSEIYEWIGDHFPFYQESDDKWKNSVRHNLSINPHFAKGKKSERGGHLWKMVSVDHTLNNNKFSHNICKKRRHVHSSNFGLFSKFNNKEQNSKLRKISKDIRFKGFSSFNNKINSLQLNSQKSLAQCAKNILYGEPKERVQVELLSSEINSFSPKYQWPQIEYVNLQNVFLNQISLPKVQEDCNLSTDFTIQSISFATENNANELFNLLNEL